MQIDATAILQTILNYATLTKNEDIIRVVIGAMAKQAGRLDSPDLATIIDMVLASSPRSVTVNSVWGEVQTPMVRVPVTGDSTTEIKQLLAEITQNASKSP
ncbi:MAG: hypothetical protein V9H26_20185 [Verrucomicrobiota bacterium]|nr:hypothetical protein [Verrucomicrobiota bacterium]